MKLCVGRRDQPNSLRVHPNFSFRAVSLSPRVILFLRELKRDKQQGVFINDAINFYYSYRFGFKTFIKNLIELNYGIIRHALRRAGRKRSENGI